MKLAVITHTPHFKKDGKLYAYGPYVREMNLWFKHADTVLLVAPLRKDSPDAIHEAYASPNVRLHEIPAISFISLSEGLLALFRLPVIKWKIFQAMRKADHIHLRCPGTIGLVGCMMQPLFPKRPKTAKYAGNWDPQAKQPFSYRLQRWILKNTFLTRNMKVLVYGDWPKQTSNIKPFFTASYPKQKIEAVRIPSFKPPFRLLYVGGLTPGKRPQYAVALLEALRARGFECTLDMYGDGSERDSLAAYLEVHQLTGLVTLHGNQPPSIVTNAYKQSHLLLLPSRSEGWPKVVAEAMFWGIVPVVSRVSCVPWMLDEGKRGILLEMNLDEDAANLETHVQQPMVLQEMARKAQEWSHQYTLDAFENELKKMLR
ncbi:glycosyltransferase [Altibacter sp.]|uniref:glycosyltransferase family 4 protein n=1 Tax=Altibacter sp. TaxID=2024823 RepID=UPI000C8FB1BC|nr:glycosyltransferase [Altibacter sp.]MAP54798.1 glycosyl transferase [Altibacter sp.]